MQPINQTSAGTAQLENQARAQGQALQNQYNRQAGQTYGEYQQQRGQANQAYQNLLNYTKNLPNYGQLYGQYQQGQENQLGYNPQTMQNYAKNATTLAETMANLPQAVQQQGNYSGATAGQIAQNYAAQAPQIAQAQAGTNAGLQNYLNMYQAASGAAQQQAQNALAGQQLASQNYQTLYSEANKQMATAGQVLNNIEGLQQQQGYLTAQQVSAYQNARNNYISAQAAAENAAANMISAQANAAKINQQVAYMNKIQGAMQRLYGNNWQVAMAELAQGQSPNVPTAGGQGGININVGGNAPLQSSNLGSLGAAGSGVLQP